jgi:tripartite-type tricarboxylate transporter receptor subunit TctC
MNARLSSRRSMLQLGLGAAFTVALPASAASSYPTRPITVVCPFPPGGSDTLLRLLVPALQGILGQPVVVENTVGASGLIGSERVARAPADGYMLLFAASTAITATVLYRNTKVDMLRDFAPIMNTHEVPQVLVVHPSLPVSTVGELIALAKSRPQGLSFGSAGNGSTQHLNGELFNATAGVQMLHVPFKGIGPMLVETLAGRVPVAMTTITQTHSYVTTGRLKALAILDNKGSPFLPGVPPITDTLPGFRQSDSWSCILAPAGTPAAIRDTLLQSLKHALEAKEVRALFAQNFATITALPPTATGERVRAELERTRKLMKVAGIQPE